jgi:hypothetical protein
MKRLRQTLLGTLVISGLACGDSGPRGTRHDGGGGLDGNPTGLDGPIVEPDLPMVSPDLPASALDRSPAAIDQAPAADLGTVKLDAAADADALPADVMPDVPAQPDLAGPDLFGKRDLRPPDLLPTRDLRRNDAGAPDRSDAPRTSDSGSIDAPVACTGPLEERYYGGCPATFDGHPETFPCPNHVNTLAAAVIDGRQVIYWESFPGMGECVYASANAGAALIGQVEIADSLVYCDRTSYRKLFGSLPNACSEGWCPLEYLSILCRGSSCTCPLDGGGAEPSSDGAVGAADSGD